MFVLHLIDTHTHIILLRNIKMNNANKGLVKWHGNTVISACRLTYRDAYHLLDPRISFKASIFFILFYSFLQSCCWTSNSRCLTFLLFVHLFTFWTLQLWNAFASAGKQNYFLLTKTNYQCQSQNWLIFWMGTSKDNICFWTLFWGGNNRRRKFQLWDDFSSPSWLS